MNGTNAQIVFKNGSYIKVVTAGDSARGNRAHILLIDEFRLVPKDTVDTILSKFLISNRMPDYLDLTKEEREKEYEKESNKTLYLSSAYFSDSWAYRKCEDAFNAMAEGNMRHFVCGFPYQIAIQEGLLSVESVEDQMRESDFSEVKWAMEMGAEWFGAAEDAWFDFDSMSRSRRIEYPALPYRLSSKLANSAKVRIPIKKPNEVRILSADIALMSSKKYKNDATALFINQMLPTKAGRYMRNIIYADAVEGMHTEDQALLIRRLFEEYECDYIVLDCQGVGAGIYDCLIRDIADREYGELYPALSCCNNTEMAARCTVQGAKKVIWAVKASAQFNSDCAFLLREAFRSGRIRLLATEYDGEALMKEIKGFDSLSPSVKQELMMPYIHTTLLIDELTKLQHEESNGKVRIYERSGTRKDRYSSLAYSYYVSVQLEQKLNKKQNTSKIEEAYIIKPPDLKGKAVNRARGKNTVPKWY